MQVGFKKESFQFEEERDRRRRGKRYNKLETECRQYKWGKIYKRNWQVFSFLTNFLYIFFSFTLSQKNIEKRGSKTRKKVSLFLAANFFLLDLLLLDFREKKIKNKDLHVHYHVIYVLAWQRTNITHVHTLSRSVRNVRKVRCLVAPDSLSVFWRAPNSRKMACTRWNGPE